MTRSIEQESAVVNTLDNHLETATNVAPVDDSKAFTEHLEAQALEAAHTGTRRTFKGGVTNVGEAVIEQKNVIPQTGVRKPSSAWEYWTYTLFYFHSANVALGNYGGATMQSLLHQAFPSGKIHWGGRTQALNAMVLDLNGILFAVQCVVLLFLGPYADYGTWRPWVMVIGEAIVWIVIFSFTGLHKASQWQAATALYVLGNLAVNVTAAFFQASFPGIVRDSPKLIESEEAVLRGEKPAEEHAELDMLERSKLYMCAHIVSSASEVVTLSAAVGIAHAVGNSTQAEVNKGYQVLLGYFGALQVFFTLPYLICMKIRPGQQLPADTTWILAGPKQVWEAGKHLWELKQVGLYLLAYFLISETLSTTGNVAGILQNQTIHYNTEKFSGLTLTGYVAGGSGTIFYHFLQQRYKISVKAMIRYGAIIPLLTSFWGVLGIYTKAIGYHNAWEFWVLEAWNFQGAVWAAYAIIMISEIAPAPKMFLFFALFNCVGKTSSFIGPFISAAIINAANGNTNYAFWYIFAQGLVGNILLWFVNPDKAKIANAKFLEREAEALYSQEQRDTATYGVPKEE